MHMFSPLKKIIFSALLLMGVSPLQADINYYLSGGGQVNFYGNGSSQIIISSGPTGGGPSNTFLHYRTITISSANVSNVLGSAIANMPVELAFSTAVFNGHLQNASGYDMVFTTNTPTGPAGTYSCPYHIAWDTETFSISGGTTAIVWVDIPQLTTATLTAATYYMCYGDSSISTYVGASTATWDSNYAAVWHFPNGTSSLGLLDSTKNQNNGTARNSATYGAGRSMERLVLPLLPINMRICLTAPLSFLELPVLR